MCRPVDDMDVTFREYIIPYGHSGYLALYHYDGDTAVFIGFQKHLYEPMVA